MISKIERKKDFFSNMYNYWDRHRHAGVEIFLDRFCGGQTAEGRGYLFVENCGQITNLGLTVIHTFALMIDVPRAK